MFLQIIDKIKLVGSFSSETKFVKFYTWEFEMLRTIFVSYRYRLVPKTKTYGYYYFVVVVRKDFGKKLKQIKKQNVVRTYIYTQA